MSVLVSFGLRNLSLLIIQLFMKNKCVFVIGPESSGSKLIARICSHALGIKQFEDWNGTGWSDNGNHKVLHRSLPYDNPPKFPDIDEWISANEKEYELYLILTTRDITVSEFSRLKRWGKSSSQSIEETEKARIIMTSVMKREIAFFIWSYETFLFLGKDYLDCLYKFLGINSDFIPELIDGNRGKFLK
ncbi:MAG: hypothetical protein ACOYNC_04165 [Bacteroidales bacterium]